MLLSVVLVVRRHQAWIRPCLRSFLDQAPGRSRRDRHRRRVPGPRGASRRRRRAGRLASAHAPVGHPWRHRRVPRDRPRDRPRRLRVVRRRCRLPAARCSPAGELRARRGAGRPAGRRGRTRHLRRAASPGRAPRAATGMRDRIVRRDHLLGMDRPAGDDLSDVPLAVAVLGRGARVELARDRPSSSTGCCRPGSPTAWSDSDPWAVFAAFDRAFAELADAGGSADAQGRAADGHDRRPAAAAGRRTASPGGSSTSTRCRAACTPMALTCRSRRMRRPGWCDRAIAADSYRLYRALLRSHGPRCGAPLDARPAAVPRNRSGLKTRRGRGRLRGAANGGRSTRTSPCSRPTGARRTRATPGPSTRRPASWRRGFTASGW